MTDLCDFTPLPRCGVVLFDIDGTLIAGPKSGPSAGYIAMERAAIEVAGRPIPTNLVDFSGQTDVRIAQLLLKAARSEATIERIELLLKKYLQYLEGEMLKRPYQPLGDPPGAIGALSKAGFICGLGTGNLRQGARLKLECAGILKDFQPELGGYADDSPLRPTLISLAAQRCDPKGELPVVVVGDTLHDVQAAKAIGARCIGVPFGNSSTASLFEAGADVVIPAVGPIIAEICSQWLTSS
jgi:phosphoglycolate phosphatase-like HAD superfamily hydrolase